MRYKVKSSFTIKVGNDYFKVDEGTLWNWKEEKGSFITIENDSKDVITISRSDFVKLFEIVY